MEAFKTVILIINIFSSLAIIGLVLMQHGKGADAGAGFNGSGSAQGVFGSAGNANFLTRMTAISASVFFASCLALGYANTNHKTGGLDFSNVQQSSQLPPAHANTATMATHTASAVIPASAVAKDETPSSAVANSSSETHIEMASSVATGTKAAAIGGAAAAAGLAAKNAVVDNKDKQADKKNTAIKTKEKTQSAKKTTAKTRNKTSKKAKH